MSLVIAYAVGAILAATGIVLSLLYTGSALVTTAIGTLLPILSDANELRTRLGTYLLAAGSVGELGPVLLLTLFLSAQGTVHNALILLAFVAVAVGVALLTLRVSKRTLPSLDRTLEHFGQQVVGHRALTAGKARRQALGIRIPGQRQDREPQTGRPPLRSRHQ